MNTPNRSIPPQNSNPASPGSGQSELHSASSTFCASAARPPLLHWHVPAFSTPANVCPRRAHACRHWLMRSRLVSKGACAEASVSAGASGVSAMQPW